MWHTEIDTCCKISELDVCKYPTIPTACLLLHMNTYQALQGTVLQTFQNSDLDAVMSLQVLVCRLLWRKYVWVNEHQRIVL